MTRHANAAAPVAVIDIGTNSTKLLIGRAHGGRVHTIHFARETTRLGEGLGFGRRIDAAAVTRTVRVVRRFATTAHRHHARAILAVGTYALRTAANGRAAAERIARESGISVRVLSGREEATLAFLSARARVVRPRPYTFLIDVGGGSTQLVVAHHGRVLLARSLPLGALRLTERHLHSDPIARDEYLELTREIDARVERVVSGFDNLRPTSIDLIACGGSATTALDMARRGRPSDRTRLHSLTRADARRLERACLHATVAERRRMPGLPADRADIIPAGIAVVLAFMTRVHKRVIRISDGGVREGVILAHLK